MHTTPGGLVKSNFAEPPGGVCVVVEYIEHVSKVSANLERLKFDRSTL